MKKIIKLSLLSLGVLFAATNAYSQTIKPTLNHIAHYVNDLKKCTDFYRDIVHLDTIPEPFHDGRHTWFSIGSKIHLHLIQGAGAVTAHDKNSHLCFTVASVNDYMAMLKKNNIEFESWLGEKGVPTHRVDGVYQIYFKDPEGYWIEINDAKE